MILHYRNALRLSLHRRNLNLSQITVTDISNLDAGIYEMTFLNLRCI